MKSFDISKKYEHYTEQRIIYENGTWGRADLINSDGLVWDVKPNKPHHIVAREIQVKKYTEGKWKYYEEIKLSPGDNSITSDSLDYETLLYTYHVTYENAGNGVITYDYTVTKNQYQTNLDVNVAVIATIVFVLILAVAVGAPIGVVA